MSLEKIVLLSGFLAAGGCAGEERSVNVGEVVITEAVTDNGGKALFTEKVLAQGQTEEDVEYEITGAEVGLPVADAEVLYFDNLFSEGSLVSHPAFAPQLNIALHNSGHQYSLTPAPLQILHKGNEKEQSKEGAKKFFSWAKNNWKHRVCLNKGEMVTLMKPGVYLMKILDVFETIGFSERDLDKSAEYIKKEMPESAVADVYSFIPSKHGFRATTTITALEVKLDGDCAEDNFNSNDANDDHGDCAGLIFCDYFRGTSLDTGKWNVLSDSGIEVYGNWLSLPDASSIGTRNGFGNHCSDINVKIKTGFSNGVFTFGNGIELYAIGDKVKLSCGAREMISDVSPEYNTLELLTNKGALYLQANGSIRGSIPCSAKPNQMHITAGFNDLVEVDYVEVKCK